MLLFAWAMHYLFDFFHCVVRRCWPRLIAYGSIMQALWFHDRVLALSLFDAMLAIRLHRLPEIESLMLAVGLVALCFLISIVFKTGCISHVSSAFRSIAVRLDAPLRINCRVEVILMSIGKNACLHFIIKYLKHVRKIRLPSFLVVVWLNIVGPEWLLLLNA